ncbi:hydantoinase B/oxoprolinase family protein [Paenarthrobacter ureafaciens]|uniref:hydantoinase B/oxoprolinase family protein n=1 Tax=Paenarthrobacter ureafaciens TaxID=37931 RepID=UPI0009AEB7DD|nr:hydantoinase B/oxoprolinase family protein [Paenarthrobacter ureafaciens]GLU61524.1 N-methylhydantoinase [Paenarthrobacter ureafaciens]GLU65797.1 N-methylhydantoinase [Paenarthrobacter ureafaciens]GLU70126.1 N-methylhydantoinase [Paenarthrobacter ureafaciens]GLU74356.1 N-methylhydantoinase [Paenarthrobacter ureafaciens]GLU78612.1 N-methylhydantoinase [Paenarthrobacter ureafaciens]
MTDVITMPDLHVAHTGARQASGLDPVTFEVLKNAFVTSVDLMSEQILRTCYSFVIYSRDFSSALCDANGNTVMQGSGDIAVHVGTLHFQCKAVIDEFKNDIHPGDVFAINDPYRGGTHFNDVSFIRPIFADGEIIAFAQNKGHWADIGGNVPGSFDVNAKEHFGEGLRITPVRIWSKGVFLHDVAQLLVSNTRAPRQAMGDLHAQSEATAVCEREVLRLVEKYSKTTVVAAMQETQDYVERIVLRRLESLPQGVWETTDYIDFDPGKGEGLVPIKIKLTLDGKGIHYDLTGSAPAVETFLNSGYGTTHSAIYAGTKTFFPDVPLNSGFYAAVEAEIGPEGTVVNAGWPYAVTGFCSGPYEKLMNGIFELWSQIMPERAMACAFNLEYLLVGGRDGRTDDDPYFMWYDWMAGGWGGRSSKDGSSATAPVFGPGLAVQPIEGQERLSPVLTTVHQIGTDSGGPGRFRGGLGIEKGGTLVDATNTVVSYCCDRARSITWGIEGGLPSIPHGVWMNKGTHQEKFLGSNFSAVPLHSGDSFTRPSAGGGGYGDPLDRPFDEVLEDVIDEYVSIERAAKDYGVIIREIDRELDQYEVDEAASIQLRQQIRADRPAWLTADPAVVAEKYRAGEVDMLDVIRRHGVILDWGTGELFPETTSEFRKSMEKRSSSYWY